MCDGALVRPVMPIDGIRPATAARIISHIGSFRACASNTGLSIRTPLGFALAGGIWS